MLRRFTHDLREPVAKGEFGGRRGARGSGRHWAALRRDFSESRSERRLGIMLGWTSCAVTSAPQKAEIALIVSTALPKGIGSFDLVYKVWITEPRFAIPLAIALQQPPIDVAASHQAQLRLNPA